MHGSQLFALSFLLAVPAAAQTLALDDWTYFQLDNTRTARAFGLDAGDVTGDGLPDLVSGRWIYANPGGDMSAPWPRVTLPWDVDILAVLNVDGDSRKDMIAMTPDGRILWLESTGSAQSWIQTEVADLGFADHSISTQGFRAAQLEAGGKPELLFTLDTLAYLRIPANPNVTPWPRVEISSSIDPEGVAAADIDGDGDLDVAATPNTVDVRWYRNPGNGAGAWASFAIGSVPSQYADRFELGDLNGDGRTDLAVSGANGSNDGLYWFESPANPAAPWTRRTVASQDTTNSMDMADLDGDGDLDLVSGEHRGSETTSVWENDGTGSFTEIPIASGIESHLGTQLFDLDMDGDLDLASIAWDKYWFLHVWRNDAIGGPPPVPPAPVARYSMNELIGTILHDRTGLGHDGQLVGGASFGADAGGGFLRTGGGRAELGSWQVGSSEISIAAWIRPKSFNVSDGRIVSRADGVAEQSHDWMLSTIASGGQMRLRARLRVGGNVTTLVASSGNLPLRRWTHVALVFDGQALKLYQNAVLVGQTSLAGVLAERSSIPIAIGAQPGGAAPFDGRLDEVRIFTGALPLSKIQNMAAGRPAFRQAE